MTDAIAEHGESHCALSSLRRFREVQEAIHFLAVLASVWNFSLARKAIGMLVCDLRDAYRCVLLLMLRNVARGPAEKNTQADAYNCAGVRDVILSMHGTTSMH